MCTIVPANKAVQFYAGLARCKRAVKRSNSCVMYKDSSLGVSFDLVKYFLSVENEATYRVLNKCSRHEADIFNNTDLHSI